MMHYAANKKSFHNTQKGSQTASGSFYFSLNSGDKAVIISEEGNGKSTLLKLIYDSRLVDSYVEYTGEILTQGTLMGYLPQEFPPEYKEQTIYTYCTSIPAFQTGIRENWPLSPPGFGFPRIFLLRPAVRHTFGR